MIGPYRAHTLLQSESADVESECPRGMRGSARERLNEKLAAQLGARRLEQEWKLLHDRRERCSFHQAWHRAPPLGIVSALASLTKQDRQVFVPIQRLQSPSVRE